MIKGEINTIYIFQILRSPRPPYNVLFILATIRHLIKVRTLELIVFKLKVAINTHWLWYNEPVTNKSLGGIPIQLTSWTATVYERFSDCKMKPGIRTTFSKGIFKEIHVLDRDWIFVPKGWDLSKHRVIPIFMRTSNAWYSRLSIV